jgi:hypothetical protein
MIQTFPEESPNSTKKHFDIRLGFAVMVSYKPPITEALADDFEPLNRSINNFLFLGGLDGHR